MVKTIHFQVSLKVVVLSLTIISLSTLSGWLLYEKLQPIDSVPLPRAITSELEFTPIMIRADASNYMSEDFDYSAVEDNTKVLSYKVSLPSGNHITVTQYPQPQQFMEIPDFKDKFLENKSEQTVLVELGAIHLYHPEKQKDKQIGLMLEKGLLIFFNPDQNLDQAEWRAFGNSLTTQRL